VDKLVLKVALEYKNSISNCGGHFSFPKADNIINTYSYRTFNAFVNRCRSDRLEDNQILEMVRIIVKYMHRHRIMKKGVGILSSPDIIDICVNELKGNINKSDNVTKLIIESNDFLNKQSNKIEFLLKKVNKNGFSNLVFLRCKGILPDVFICCSKSCMNVYFKLDISDKSMMLEPKNYMILKMKIINIVGIDHIKEIMGDDSNV
jgi:hypothetical protein